MFKNNQSETLPPFGLRNNKLFHISEVDAGLACDCICPDCLAPLIARKGKQKIHHFAHYTATNCEGNPETLLHLAAKQILQSQKRIRLPAVELCFPAQSKKWLVYSPKMLHFDTVSLEKKQVNVIPDLAIYRKDVPLFIEINVTHAISDQKLEKLRKLKTSVLEVKIEPVWEHLNFPALTKRLIYEVKNKKWIINRKAAYLQKQILELGEKKPHHFGKHSLYVKNCPLRSTENRSFPANVSKDCWHCPYCMDTGLQTASDTVICTGKTGISSYRDYLSVLSEKKV